MLSKILSSKECASCRNCCIFHEESRWEAPVASGEQAEKIKKALHNDQAVSLSHNRYLLQTVQRDSIPYDGAEPYRCAALDETSGCRLASDEKPFDCSLWPLRIMRKNNKLFITIAKGCSSVDDAFIQKVKLLLQEGLQQKILNEINKNPDIIKECAPNYIELAELNITMKPKAE